MAVTPECLEGNKGGPKSCLKATREHNILIESDKSSEDILCTFNHKEDSDHGRKVRFTSVTSINVNFDLWKTFWRKRKLRNYGKGFRSILLQDVEDGFELQKKSNKHPRLILCFFHNSVFWYRYRPLIYMYLVLILILLLLEILLLAFYLTR